ncbi:VOC family protein [Sphingomonas mesophila]|uniref:VOC family protein n=1 Tax=Sphingomonas mesophila TaxID=2303576 RepID=UPI00196818E9|nr:VOC family protein [Sphingomonas mesophila]
MALKLDHLTIAVSDRERSRAHYDKLLPLIGFAPTDGGNWADSNGLYIQFVDARPGTSAYERYGAGLNHFGFAMDSPRAVEDLRERLIAAGIDCQPLQQLGGAVALFLPDPDGLRAEFTFYPPGTPPVG